MRAMRFEPAKKQAQAKPVLMTDEELAEAMEEEEDEF